jgi:hypothetical protein
MNHNRKWRLPELLVWGRAWIFSWGSVRAVPYPFCSNIVLERPETGRAPSLHVIFPGLPRALPRNRSNEGSYAARSG